MLWVQGLKTAGLCARALRLQRAWRVLLGLASSCLVLLCPRTFAQTIPATQKTLFFQVPAHLVASRFFAENVSLRHFLFLL